MSCAWILFLSLMPFFIVKATHFHDDHSVCQYANEQSGENKDDVCSICHFALSPFDDTPMTEMIRHEVIIAELYSFRAVIELSCETYIPYLRAPPIFVRAIK